MGEPQPNNALALKEINAVHIIGLRQHKGIGKENRMAQRLGRLKREVKQLQESPPPGVSCWPEGDQLTRFSAVIIGEEDTVYNGGVFELEIEIPERYPFQPPSVRFLTTIYHPNIDTAGRICLDVLKMPPSGGWRPAHNLSTILTSIRLLMQAPNPDDPLMTEIADEYRFRKSQFEATAREWTKKFTTEKVGKKNTEKDDSLGDSLDKNCEPDKNKNIAAEEEGQPAKKFKTNN